MDLATLIGIILGIACILYSIWAGGDPALYFDIPSIICTVGGGIASTLISYRLKEIISIMKIVANAFFGKDNELGDTIRKLVELSQKARREGLLALETEQENIEDDFLRRSLQLVVDGVEPEMIKESLTLELENISARHERGQGLFKTMGALFPAWGMIGTLIGLINMLNTMEDPKSIGPSMALAIITTFYGAVLAYFICIPIANKLALKSKEEIRQKELIIEGILSIQAGENPRIMEYKLKTFLSAKQREVYEARGSENSAESEQRRRASGVFAEDNK